MIAKIKIYNDSGVLVSKYEAQPYDEQIGNDDDYEFHKYYFKFIYVECVDNRQKGADR